MRQLIKCGIVYFHVNKNNYISYSFDEKWNSGKNRLFSREKAIFTTRFKEKTPGQ
ncbi:hypothetical protein FLA_4864 [Filimonas lacunae]|nr:hypothetical protein FLA_4864 [Filimonas lacunae]